MRYCCDYRDIKTVSLSDSLLTAQLSYPSDAHMPHPILSAHICSISIQLVEQNRKFYCALCDKQYKNAMEIQLHLSSYDHHHTKRLKEMKVADSTVDGNDKLTFFHSTSPASLPPSRCIMRRNVKGREGAMQN